MRGHRSRVFTHTARPSPTHLHTTINHTCLIGEDRTRTALIAIYGDLGPDARTRSIGQIGDRSPASGANSSLVDAIESYTWIGVRFDLWNRITNSLCETGYFEILWQDQSCEDLMYSYIVLTNVITLLIPF